MLYEDDHIITLDLKDAYLHIPCHKANRTFLRIAVIINKELYIFQCTAMLLGLSSVLTKIIDHL